MKIEIKDTSVPGSIEIISTGLAEIDIKKPGLLASLKEIRVTGKTSVLPDVRTVTVTSSNALPVSDTLRIEIFSPGLDPNIVTIVERGLPGPRGPAGGGGSGNGYFPQGWS